MDAAADLMQKIDMKALRAQWEERQREWIERWVDTHDLDLCPLHGFWKLGPKKGGLLVLTCPGCDGSDREADPMEALAALTRDVLDGRACPLHAGSCACSRRGP